MFCGNGWFGQWKNLNKIIPNSQSLKILLCPNLKPILFWHCLRMMKVKISIWGKNFVSGWKMSNIFYVEREQLFLFDSITKLDITQIFLLHKGSYVRLQSEENFPGIKPHWKDDIPDRGYWKWPACWDLIHLLLAAMTLRLLLQGRNQVWPWEGAVRDLAL